MQKIVLITATEESNILHHLSNNLGTLALEAYLSANTDIKTYVVDTVAEAIDLRPDMVGISSVTETYRIAIDMAGEIKKQLVIPVIIGGQHITGCVESLDRVFDAAVIGEGEETFLELVRKFPKLDDIAGIAYFGRSGLVVNKRRPAIADIDSLPLINWKKLVVKLGIPAVMTTRGCMYKCSFCSSPIQWGGCRQYSAARVGAEIKSIVDAFHPRMIKFFDDIFTLNKKRLKNIVDIIVNEGWNEKIVFMCMSRVGHFDKEVARLLQKGNIRFVFFGVESMSKSVLGGLKDRPSTLKDIQEAVDIAYDAGIKTSCSFIIGAPGETESDILKTIKFIEKNEKKVFDIEVNPIIPNPGTPIWDYAKKRKLVSNDMDWAKIKHHSLFLSFDPSDYIYLNKKMPFDKFAKYADVFKDLFRRINLDPGKQRYSLEYFGPRDIPAKLKGSARDF